MCGLQAPRKQVKNEGAEKIHYCLPHVQCIRFFVNTFAYLKTNIKTFTRPDFLIKYLKEGFDSEAV